MSFIRRLADLIKRGGQAEAKAKARPTPAPTPRKPDPPLVRHGSRLIMAGLDFGTSSCKVVFRDLREKGRPPRAIDFGTRSPGYSRFGYPSTIALQGERLLFGEGALSASGRSSYVLSSPKVRILNDVGAIPDHMVPVTVSRHLHAYRDVDPPPSTVELLTCALLARVLRHVLDILESLYAGLSKDDVLVNVDVPVDTLERTATTERYERLASIAYDLAWSASPGQSLIASVEAWADGMERWARAANRAEESKVQLVPESQAIIQGAGEAVPREGDIYKAIVDIGAGTTDVAWFKLVQRRSGDRLPFFAAGTKRVGCDLVDAALVDGLWSNERERGALLRQVRALKPALARGEAITLQTGDGTARLEKADLARATRDVGREIYDFYSSTFGDAYSKEKNVDRWQKLHVILAGGGSLLPEIQGLFGGHPRPRAFGMDGTVELVNIGDRLSLSAVGESKEPSRPEDAPFLLPALGLSYQVFEMPEPIRPDQIEDLPPPPSGPTGIYDWDAEASR